jgi:hypothetical protein
MNALELRQLFHFELRLGYKAIEAKGDLNLPGSLIGRTGSLPLPRSFVQRSLVSATRWRSWLDEAVNSNVTGQRPLLP